MSLVDAARLVLRRVFEALQGEEAALGRLDAATGDGDHGAGMVRGMQAAAAAAANPAQTAGHVVEAAGTAFADAAGGASGALYGNMFIAIGQALPGGEIDARTLQQAMAAGLEAICALGRCKPGDKTMVDTLDPFVRAMAEQVAEGKGIVAAWQGALPAAEAGAKSTAAMISTRGRASRLGERSRGHLDAGAMSMLLILRVAGEGLLAASQD